MTTEVWAKISAEVDDIVSFFLLCPSLLLLFWIISFSKQMISCMKNNLITSIFACKGQQLYYWSGIWVREESRRKDSRQPTKWRVRAPQSFGILIAYMLFSVFTWCLWPQMTAHIDGRSHLQKSYHNETTINGYGECRIRYALLFSVYTMQWYFPVMISNPRFQRTYFTRYRRW